MRKLCLLSVISCMSILFTTGCATIVRGTKDVLVVESDPVGADVELSNGMRGKTPASFKLPRKESLVVKIEKAGYEKVEVNVIPKISGAGGAGMAGNVVLGGLIGAAVDVGSGAMNDPQPNPIKVTLVPLDGKPPAGAVVREEKKSAEQRLQELKVMFEKGLITQEEFDTKRESVLEEL